MKTKQMAKTSLTVAVLLGFFAVQPVQAQLVSEGPGFKAPPLPSSAKTLEPGEGTALPGGGSTGAPAAGDIRDIRGPHAIAEPWLWALYVIGGALGLLVLWLVWLALGRKRQPAKLPHEMAFEALERARALMQPQREREFCFAVSDAIRQYIERRFSLYATHQTTREFLRDLIGGENAVLSGHGGFLNDFLKNCDLGKFARWGLTGDEMEAMFQNAWEFVEQTKPRTETGATGKEKPSKKFRSMSGSEEAPGQNLAVGGI